MSLTKWVLIKNAERSQIVYLSIGGLSISRVEIDGCDMYMDKRQGKNENYAQKRLIARLWEIKPVSLFY